MDVRPFGSPERQREGDTAAGPRVPEKTICEAPPKALRFAKRCVDTAEDGARAAALQVEIDAIVAHLKQGGGLGKP